MHAEGFSPEEFGGLPADICDLAVSQDAGAPLVLGRQHQQRRFDALLAKSPGCLSFISRTHMQLEARQAGLHVGNLSLNPVYIDREPLGKGEARDLLPDQVLSFARLEGSAHVLFLSFKVCGPKDASPTGERTE